MSEEPCLPTTEAVLRALPGGAELFDWFGYAPSFHDGVILSLNLSCEGPSAMRIHAWEMTDQVDDKRYFLLRKHVVVTLRLGDVTEVRLSNFGSRAIIGLLWIVPIEGQYRISWYSAVGVDGSIEARTVRVELTPGEP